MLDHAVPVLHVERALAWCPEQFANHLTSQSNPTLVSCVVRSGSDALDNRFVVFLEPCLH
jgi:hypothetical protein